MILFISNQGIGLVIGALIIYGLWKGVPSFFSWLSLQWEELKNVFKGYMREQSDTMKELREGNKEIVESNREIVADSRRIMETALSISGKVETIEDKVNNIDTKVDRLLENDK